MYLKSIVLDGFKSYGKRTEVSGFDRQFNAITGLNGSGKSNILDSICFVLGITKLEAVRAGSLQDLIYKNGQAGVTKASVTLIFDNSDPHCSPLGYEQYDEITITRQVILGGKNKYLINGANVQNRRVQDLFGSVQLNVNNPHFLIMQGRITKVLNMKPPEILSMIEEAAGTRMYENKKQTAQKTIEKKDAKLKELVNIINEDITPKIQKLKAEQGQYMEYQKITRDLERLTKIYVAWCYHTSEKTVDKAIDECNRIFKRIHDAKVKITTDTQNIAELENSIGELQKKKDLESGNKLEDLEKDLKELEKSEAKSSAKLKSAQESIASEKKKLQHLEKNLKEDESALVAKEAELKKVEGLFQKLKDTDQADSEALAEAQKKFQAVSSGLLSSESGEAATLQEQLIAAKQEMSKAETEIKQSEMKISHSTGLLNEKQKEMKQTEKDYEKDKKSLDNMEKELKSYETEMSMLNYEEGTVERLTERRKQLISEVRRLKDKTDTFEARYPQIFFQYKNPEPNFDRSSVKGTVSQLIKMKDPITAAALEVAAGGRLYNVIVDTETVSKKLLEKGQLQHRTTFIPLNKIQGRSLDNQTIKFAEQLVGKENVYPALSMIEYDKKLHPAMQFAFGTTFICKDMDVASKVAFHERIMKKCVTLEGDVCDPGGTLSGGARSKSSPILIQIEEMCALRNDLKAKESELQDIENQLRSLTKIAEKYNSVKQNMELRQHQVQLVRQKLQQTTHYRYQEEVNALQETIEQLKEKIQICKKAQADNNKKVKDLEDKVKNAKAIREQELKAAENEMNKLKKKAEESRKCWKQREQDFETLNLEITELRKSIDDGRNQIKDSEETIVQLTEGLVTLKEEVSTAKNLAKEALDKVKSQKETINMQNKEIQQAINKKDKMKKDISSLELDIKKWEHDAAKTKAEADECRNKLKQLEKDNPWIDHEREFFGQPKGAYDFEVVDIKQMARTITSLEERKDEMGRKLNIRAMNMLGKEEEQYNELLAKKKIVENDKSKIMLVIQELDEKKKLALRKAWEQVNKDFGSIFSTLLPGAQACLRPPEGMDVLDGLEVKIGFSGIWKESLAELSGGQRSLVALSLILAMLLFKPAPIYILDEVDAALDLSHTQNIGNMLRSHFKHSQFIVVSLKDGMFNNANVLFRTQFIDGMSTVRRFVQNPTAVSENLQQNKNKKHKK